MSNDNNENKEIKVVDFEKLLNDVRTNLVKEIKEENIRILADAFNQFKKENEQKEEVKEESTKKELLDF